jgi:hypothetical protein
LKIRLRARLEAEAGQSSTPGQGWKQEEIRLGAAAEAEQATLSKTSLGMQEALLSLTS